MKTPKRSALTQGNIDMLLINIKQHLDLSKERGLSQMLLEESAYFIQLLSAESGIARKIAEECGEALFQLTRRPTFFPWDFDVTPELGPKYRVPLDIQDCIKSLSKCPADSREFQIKLIELIESIYSSFRRSLESEGKA